MGSQKAIIDVDTGVDDAEALMIALSYEPAPTIVAITCVHGNASIDQVCLNTLTVLRACGAEQVPVYKGAHTPLLKKGPDGTYHHGEDGLGGVTIGQARDLTLLQSEHAVNALVRLAREHKGEITLIALAPLTNIALALRMDPEFCNNLKQVVIMGGNIEGRGNITTSGEFNFASDPESACITLNELKCPIRLLAWEPCLKHGLDWDWFENIHAVDTPKSHFHTKMTAFSCKRKKEVMKMAQFYSCDPTCMVVALCPSSVLQSKHVYCTVELNGEITRGQMVVDWIGKLNRPENVEIILKVDSNITMACYEKMLV